MIVGRSWMTIRSTVRCGQLVGPRLNANTPRPTGFVTRSFVVRRKPGRIDERVLISSICPRTLSSLTMFLVDVETFRVEFRPNRFPRLTAVRRMTSNRIVADKEILLRRSKGLSFSRIRHAASFRRFIRTGR